MFGDKRGRRQTWAYYVQTAMQALVRSDAARARSVLERIAVESDDGSVRTRAIELLRNPQSL